MKLINFPEVNVVVAKDQSQYRPLPAYRYPDFETGRLLCCWQLSFWERLKILVSGRVWHQILTFNKPLQPQKLTVEKPRT